MPISKALIRKTVLQIDLQFNSTILFLFYIILKYVPQKRDGKEELHS